MFGVESIMIQPSRARLYQAGQGGAARIVGVHRAAVFLEQTGENAAGQFIVVDDQETVV